MYKLLFTILIVNLINIYFGQCTVNGANLIPNPSFETTNANCGVDNQAYTNQSPFASWIGTDPLINGGSTPDVCRKPTTTACGQTFPETFNTASASVFTGSKCAGMFVYMVGPTNGREYIQAPLTSSLIAGRTYCFSADLRMLNFGTALNCNGFGAHFRNGSAINIQTMNGGTHFLGTGSTLNLLPQLQLSNAQIVTHTANLNFTGTFVATGGENRIVLGNFRNDASTTRSGTGTTSYLLVDNLKLYEVPIVLPIELLDFTADCENFRNRLQWSVASENNNESFSLEKSCDGISFEPIATIQGAGFSNETTNYQFIDKSFCSDISYYKLFQTDYDGNKRLLQTIVSNCKSNNIKLFTESNFITIHNGSEEIIGFQIYNSIGQLVMNFSDQNIPANQNKQFALNEISSGVYFVRLKNSTNQEEILRFFKE